MAAGGERVIGVLQAGRALAALAVLTYHAAYATHDFAAPLSPGVFHASEQGTYGVDFFFVLSGFIILHAHEDDPRGRHAAGRYLRKRLTRIFVPYLPVSLAMIGLYLALPGVSGSARDWSLLTSLTLIPTGSPPALAAAWTLQHEMIFYVIFLASYAVRGFPVFAAWVGLILIGISLGYRADYAAPTWANAFAAINLEFVFGMLACRAARVASPRWAPLCLALGAAGLTAYFALGIDPVGPWRPLLGLVLALLVLGGVLLERAGHIAVPGWLILTGNASYAIYLVHAPLASLAARVMGKLGTPGGWPASVALCVALGIAAGLIYHLAYERPALALARGRFSRRMAVQ